MHATIELRMSLLVARQPRNKHFFTTTARPFSVGPCRGVILETIDANSSVSKRMQRHSDQLAAVSGWQSSKRTETRSTEEYKRSACEDLLCELKALLGVCDPDYV
jgi:hypothetical protein